MMSHDSWESSSDGVSKEDFFRNVKIRRSEPSQALEEEYSRSHYMMMQWQQGTGSHRVLQIVVMC